jgi:hypothetical protein
METPQSIPPRQILLLSHARTGCHLLQRMLSAQPNTSYGNHYFAPARPLLLEVLEGRPLAGASAELQQQLGRAFQSGYDNLEAFLDDARQTNTQAFFHGHPLFMVSPALAWGYVHRDSDAQDDPKWTVHTSSTGNHTSDHRTNSTILPDIFFNGTPTIAIFTIRHPLLMIPSIYRGTAEIEGPIPSSHRLRFSCTLRWSRMLYDWIIDQGISAVIIDAKEYMNVQTVRPFMTKLCQATGLDADAVIYRWPKATSEELAMLPTIQVAITRDILKSEGLRADKVVGELVPEQEEAKWREEFGEEIASLLSDLMKTAMEDYLYMRGKALKLD